MIKHNVILHLKNLNHSEISLLRQFLNSPYHNKSKKLLRFFNKLIKYYPDFTSRKLTGQNLLNQVSPGVKYNDSTFRVLMHDLYLLIQSFLVNESLTANRIERTMILLRDLHKRKLYGVMNRQIRSADRLLINTPLESNTCYNRFLIESHKFNINAITSAVLRKEIASKRYKFISGSDIYLTLYYMTEIISDLTNQVIYKAKFNIDDPDSFSKTLPAALDFNKLFRVFKNYREVKHLAGLYEMLYNLFSDITNKSKFEKYRDFLRKSEKLISGEEASFHYSKLISCCILNHETSGSLYYNNELFYLYNYFLKKKLYSDSKSGFMPANFYRTVLLNALRLRKYKWALNFIKRYINESDERSRPNLLNWSYAVYYSETNDNSRSLEYISLIKADYFIFKYDLYNIKLKIFYETGSPENAIDFIHSYKEFLRNDKFFSGNRKLIYRNFIEAVELMIKCREKKNAFDTDRLKNRILGNEKILYKEWLLEKIQLI